MPVLGLVGVLWVLYGYSLAFGTDKGGFIGGFNFLGLKNVGQEPSPVYATTVPHLAFMIFQAMFAIITVALITGAIVERMKFSALLVFSALWLTLVYCPVAHWVWGSGGWLAKLGALDFAGGTVVHINAGVSALALALLLGTRRGFPQDAMEPNNIPLVVLGAGLLWFGWFGFNAGSALTSGGLAASAFVATNTAAAAAAFTWMILSWMHKRPTVLGTVTGAVVGLVAITPAAGFCTAPGRYPHRYRRGYHLLLRHGTLQDKARRGRFPGCLRLPRPGRHVGRLATGIFASVAVNSAGANGLVYGDGMQVLKQLVGIVAVGAYAFGVTWVLGKLVDITIGLRVGQQEETVGLDLSQHGERAYGGLLR